MVDTKINILPNIIDLNRDNDLKLKFLKKVDILTIEVDKKKGQSQTNFGLKKAYFWGHPLFLTVQAKLLGIFTKYFAISIHYGL